MWLHDDMPQKEYGGQMLHLQTSVVHLVLGLVE
jgi:hypothetical protein